MRAGRAGLRDVSPVSSRGRPGAGDEVAGHGLLDEVGEPALKAAHGLVESLPGSDFAVVAGAARGGVAQLNHGHHVQGLAGLAVPAAGEPVPDVVAGGGIDGGGPGPGRHTG